MAESKGKVKETLGWATGDRRVQAEGRVEAEDGDTGDETKVKDAEREVRRDEGDVRDKRA
jgi:uncharacterized protein YjbJ (UPF0337 family)